MHFAFSCFENGMNKDKRTAGSLETSEEARFSTIHQQHKPEREQLLARTKSPSSLSQKPTFADDSQKKNAWSELPVEIGRQVPS